MACTRSKVTFALWMPLQNGCSKRLSAAVSLPWTAVESAASIPFLAEFQALLLIGIPAELFGSSLVHRKCRRVSPPPRIRSQSPITADSPNRRHSGPRRSLALDGPSSAGLHRPTRRWGGGTRQRLCTSPTHLVGSWSNSGNEPEHPPSKTSPRIGRDDHGHAITSDGENTQAKEVDRVDSPRLPELKGHCDQYRQRPDR